MPSTLDEISDDDAQTYTYRLDGVLVQSFLSQQDLVRSGAGKLTYNHITNLTLNTSNGTNTFTVQSTAAGSTVTLSGGSGTNTLAGSNTANTWNLVGTNTGTLSGVAFVGLVYFSGIQNLKGGSASDTFVFADGAAVTGNGGGNTMMGNGGFNLWYGNPNLDSYPDYKADSEFFVSV